MKSHILPCPLIMVLLLLLTGSTAKAQLTAGFSATPLSGCAPLLVSFTDASAGSPDQWEWDLGNGTVSFFANPSVTYFNPGTYTIKLTVKKGGSGATEIKTKYITVYAPPVVSFAPSATGGCFPLQVNFTNNSTPGSGTLSTFMWDFGDGTTGTAQTPVHTYTGAGSYNVSLQATNSNGCSTTITSTTPIVIHAGVNASFTTGQATSCQAPAPIPFINTSTGTGILSYSWDFGDGAVSTSINPVHTYTSTGNYTVKLTTSNNTGCTNTFTLTGLVVGSATANFSAPAISCLNENITLSDLSAPSPQTLLWDFGDGGGTTDRQPVHAYTALGTYTIKLQANFGHCLDTKTKSIQIIPRPVPDFTAAVQASCKAPFTAAFTSTSTGATAWEWDFGDGTTGTGPAPSHTYTSESSFPVTLTITNSAGCKETIRKNDFIVIKKPLVELANQPQRDCIPFSFNPVLHVESVVPIIDYQWDFGDGGTGVGLAPNHVYTQKGTYTMTLTWKTADGCQETITLTDFVKVGKKVPVDFSASPRLVCASDPILFTDLTGLSTTEPIDEWYWNFGDGGASNLPSVQYAYADTGFFSVTLTVISNGCFSFLTKINHVQILPPIARFKEVIDCARPYYRAFDNTSLYNPSRAPLTFSWDFGDGATSSAEFPAHTYSAQGKYTVTLTVVNGGCSYTTSHPVIITETTMSLTATDNSVCPGGSVQFDIHVGNATNIIGYYWHSTYGSLLQNTPISTSQTFTTPGLYTISASMVDTNKCSITRQQQVRVINLVPDIVLPPAVCLNNLVSLADQSAAEPGFPIVQRVVDYGDGSPLETNPAALNHTYLKDGTYTITWKLTDSKGCSNSTTRNLIIANPAADFNSPDIASCVGKNVVFQSISNPSYTHQWDFGDGATGSGVTPTHQYAAEGSYVISLTVEDQYGCKASATKPAYIQINNPIAQFDISATQSSCPPLVVTFINQSLNMLTAEWDFGDGNTSTLTNPVHFYTYPGEYWPVLKITSKGGCVDIIQNRKITINGPRGKFDYDKKVGCAPLVVNFTGVTNDNVSFIWDFNDGATDITTLPATTYTYTRPGKYLPKMILKDVQGCQVPIAGPDVIEVFGVTAAFQTDVLTLCDRGFVRFDDLSQSNDLITGYLWKLGDGATATANSFSHEYTATGDYLIELEVTTLHGCKSTAVSPVPLYVKPSPLAGITGPNEACVPVDFQFTGQLLNVNPYTLTWAWDFGNGQTASGQSAPLMPYTTAGSYTVKLTITNPYGCSHTATYPIVIHPLPAIDAGPDLVVCRAQPRQLQASGAVNYIWSSVEDLSCTHCAGPVINPAGTAKYYVQGESAFGCKATDSLLATVQQRFEITANKGDTLCLGEVYKLQADGADRYNWTPPAGLDNPNIAGPMAQPQTTTLYRVIGKDNNNCFEDTAFVPLVVYPYPQITLEDKRTVIIGTSVTLAPGLSPDVNSIRWDPATWLSCADCPAPLVTPTQTIQYKIQVTNEGGCITRDAITLFVVCGGENMFLPNTFSPNGDGANDIFYPMGKGIAHIKNLRIFNRWGEMVFEQYAFQANDISKGWNGKIKGTLASPDVFVYVIDVICGNGQELIFKGDVTLLR